MWGSKCAVLECVVCASSYLVAGRACVVLIDENDVLVEQCLTHDRCHVAQVCRGIRVREWMREREREKYLHC